MSEPTKLLQVLGPGCPRCRTLAENARLATAQLGINADIDKITDMNVITGFGVMMTPALVIDGEVKSVGKVLSPDQIKELLA